MKNDAGPRSPVVTPSTVAAPSKNPPVSDSHSVGDHDTTTPVAGSGYDGSAMIVRFMPENDKRLEYGQVDVYITTKPFTTKLKEAPNVMDEGAAIEFEIQRWLPQKWKNYQIPALNNLKLRGYEDMQSGGADNDVHATEPFAIKTQSGKVYWLVVKAESGYHKSLGMTLQKALNALAFE